MARLLVVILGTFLVACPGSGDGAGPLPRDAGSPSGIAPSAPERSPDVVFRRGSGVFHSKVGGLSLRYPEGWTLGVHRMAAGDEWVDLWRFHPRRGRRANFLLEISVSATKFRNRDLACARRPEPNTGEVLPDVCEFVTVKGHRWLRRIYRDGFHVPFILHTYRSGYSYRLAASHDGTDEEIDILARILSSVRFRG